MSYTKAILALVSAFLLCGCAAPTDDMMAEYYQRLALHKDAGVALPITTPFDESAAARAVYLDCYRDGFRSGLTGFMLPTSFPPGPYPTARQQGWLHGMSVGWDAWAKRTVAESRSTNH